MSLKSDLIVVGVAGLVLLAAGWYAKKKVSDAVTGVGGAVKGAMNSFDSMVDGQINAAGQFITGDAGWSWWKGHSPQWNYEIPVDFGVVNPAEGW